MAKIPVFESQRQITKLGSTPRIARETFALGAKSMQLIGRTLQEVARHFEKAQTLHETTVAETKARRRLLELEQEATTTDDIFNITRFNEGIRQIRMDTAAEVSLPLARRNFETSFDRLAMSSEFSISSTLRKRQADQMKTTMLEGIDALRGTINRENELDLLLGKGIDNLLITREAAFNLKKKTLKDWIESDIRDAIATDADTAKGNIVNGVYGDLTADETAKWLEVADKKIARNKKVAEVARDNKWLQQGGEVIKNLKETSVADLIQLTSNGDINPELGSDLVAWKTDPDSPQYETDKAIWIELAKGSTQPEVDLREFQISIGKAIANKTIQAEEGAEFVSQVEVLFEKAIAFKSRPSLKDRVIGTAIELFRQAGFPLTSIFSMIKELIEKVKKGESADELEKSATDILNKETTNQRPDIRVFGEQGQVMIDAQGNKARVFSDGRIEEIK